MEHPLIDSLDQYTVDELQDRINDLTKKLTYASRMGNGYLVNQIRMALETFQKKYQEKLQAQFDAAKKAGSDYSDRINIS